MSVSNRVPESLKGPLGAASLGVMILGLVVGYILTMLGITLFLDLNGIGGISTVESLTVTGTGVACIVLGYVGWRGFMGFAY